MNTETKTLLTALRLVSLFKRHGIEVGDTPRTTNVLRANLAVGEFVFYKLLTDARAAGLIERRDNESQRSGFRRLPLFSLCEGIISVYGIAPNKAQFAVLSACSKEPETVFGVSRLAKIAGVSKPCALENCKRLTDARGLRMERNKAGHIFFRITEKGAAFVAEISRAAGMKKDLEVSGQVV